MAGNVEPRVSSTGDQTAQKVTIGVASLVTKEKFVKSMSKLLNAVGTTQEYSKINQLVESFMEENWDKSLDILTTLGEMFDKGINNTLKFMFLEQKFLALLKDGASRQATLSVLRKDITPLNINPKRVKELAFYLILPPMLCKDDGVPVLKASVLQKLNKFFAATDYSLPERRQQSIVEDIFNFQEDVYEFETKIQCEIKLFCDSQHGSVLLPSETIQILEEHNQEVWSLAFSPKGKYLASTSNDKAAIWEVTKDGRISLKHELSNQKAPATSISWNGDDSQILTCGVAEMIRRWDVSSGECLHVYRKGDVGTVNCGWSGDEREVIAFMSNNTICSWALNGREIKSCNRGYDFTSADMVITSDGKIIITCSDKALSLLDWLSEDEREVMEVHNIFSFALSKDNNFLLVTLEVAEIHLWSIAGDPNVVSVYRSDKDLFFLTSCFGGYEEALVVSGTSTGEVYIWDRESENILSILRHSGYVDFVSWHPFKPHMFASASKDGTIRIWGPHQSGSEK